MAKPWDHSTRTLVRASPQAFTRLVIPTAHYVRTRTEKLKNMQDIIRETPVYEWILQEELEEGRKEGLEKSLREGRKEGSLEALRETLVKIVKVRFPALQELAQVHVAALEQPAVLQKLTVQVSVARDEAEARQHLLESSVYSGLHKN